MTQEQREQMEILAKNWWINFPGDPRINPGINEEYKAWASTHEKAFKAGYTLAIAKARVIEDALNHIIKNEGTDSYVDCVLTAKVALLQYQGGGE